MSNKQNKDNKIEEIVDEYFAVIEMHPSIEKKEKKRQLIGVISQVKEQIAQEIVEMLRKEKFEWDSSYEDENCGYYKDGLHVGGVAGANYNQAIKQAQQLIKNKYL